MTQLQLPATANLGEAARLAQALQGEMAAGSGTVTLDASALQVYDTSTVALLLQLRRVAQAAGRPFELLSPPAKLVQLAQLYGVDELLCPPSPVGSEGATGSATA
jgi:phospholipid transport system transporter-binding protein